MPEKVPWGTIAGVTVAAGGVAGGVWLAYKYFVEPGSQILSKYREILTDIYKETKKFLEENAKLSPPVYGLTIAQEQLIKAKEDALERIRPDVEKILKQRNIDVNSWVYSLISGIVITYVAVAVADKILARLLQWRRKPEAVEMQSSHAHSYLIYEVVTNEMAELGKLNIAGGFLSTMQSHYSSYTEPTLSAGVTYYRALIQTITPGTLAYLVATSMLSYMAFEVSAVGIMGTLWSFWMPPLLLRR